MTLRPALQNLARELPMAASERLPMHCTHIPRPAPGKTLPCRGRDIVCHSYAGRLLRGQSSLKLGVTLHAGLKTLRPALQYLAGELPVSAGEVLPLRCTHNTVRLHFDLGAAEYTHLAKPGAAFPAVHFSMLGDRRRNEARHWPCIAKDKAVSQVDAVSKELGGSALELGTGAGLHACM